MTKGHKLTKKEIMLLKNDIVLKAVDTNGCAILFDYGYMTLVGGLLYYQKDFMHLEGKAPIGFDETTRTACRYDDCIYLDVVSGEEAKKFRETVAWIKTKCPKEEDDVPADNIIDSIVRQHNAYLKEHKSETAVEVDDSKCYVMFRNEEKQLRPFVSKVLVCNGPETYWCPAIFGCKTTLDTRHYVMVGGIAYQYCIPWHENKFHAGKEFNVNYYKQ